MASKIRIRMGDVELEYEGEDSFLKDGLPDLLQSVAELHASLTPLRESEQAGSGDGGETETAITKSEHQLQMSINTIAAKLSVKKGPDLVLAALAHSELIEKKDRTTRTDMITEMRNATSFFKPSYIGNLSLNLSGLIKGGKVNELSKDVFALTDDAKKELATKLGAK